jgi:nucleoside-diphosphate-sugar epimerase
MKKIAIIGGLGYIGTELCKLYSGLSWGYEIVVIDNRFISRRVNELKKWKIKFFQADILNIDQIRPLIQDADVIHHFAGITEVAYVKKDSNKAQDELIKRTSIEGTQNILDSMNKDAKIIFPSSHVVFEGINKKIRNINENYPTNTFLAYSSGKIENEKQIKKSNKKYVILRLGSVYGYSTDTMRINIMPNLFSKISSQNGTIKLFGGGKQLKSLVPLIDVARCFKFMEERKDIKSEIFNLTKENTSVKAVAYLCKKINPKVKIEITKDEVPNQGYTLSNKKLLKTGFNFVNDLENCIKEMTENWSFKKFDKNLEYTYKGEREFVDFRGKISNYELKKQINLIGYIESKKKTIRANHYHPVQEQKCLLIKGQFISVYKDLVNKKSTKITHVVNEGDMIVTQPNVAHAMVFSKNSIFLNLVRGEREHKNYGITHTLPYKLVDKKEADLLNAIYKFECRSCGSKKLKRVISLGYQPLANNLINNSKAKIEKYPLEMNFCETCFNCQLSVSIKSEKMFTNYLYKSSTTKSFREHFKKASIKYIKDFKLNKKSFVIDVGSNDGIGLRPFIDLGFNNVLGIEPAKNLAKLSNKDGIKTINGFLDKRLIKKIKKKADLILASNVFAHSDNLKEMTNNMMKLLDNKGTIVIEVQYLVNTLRDLTFDNIYHEHYNYWSATSLLNFFNQFDLKIFNIEKINTHGGSIRVFLSKNNKIKVNKNVKDILKEEEIFGIKNLKTYEDFNQKIENFKNNVLRNIKKLKDEGKKIIGYGAPAKATTALNFLNIVNEIEFIVEDNKLKHGKLIPGVNIPIFPKTKIRDNNSIILVFAWNFFDEIKKNNPTISKQLINIKELGKN